MLSFVLLGHATVLVRGKPLHAVRSQKELALLIYLAQTGQVHSRDELAELFWQSASLAQARSNLRTLLARLNPLAEYLSLHHRSVGLHPDQPVAIDTHRFVQRLATLPTPGTTDAAATFEDVLQSYHGDFLANWTPARAPLFEEWAMGVREQLHQRVIAGYTQLGTYLQRLPDAPRVLQVARRWLQLDPLSDAAHLLLVQHLIAIGQPREALARYDAYTALVQQELRLPPSDELTELVRPLRASGPSRFAAAPPHNLPAPQNQFVGRELLQQAMHQRLDRSWCRLLTLVGIGGVGKTRLATTVGWNRVGRYPDGVWLVELADLDPYDDDPAAAIAVEIAAVLNIRFTGAASPVRQVRDALRHKRALLILDTMEHLLAGVSVLIDSIRHCPDIQFLVTSRAPLEIEGEWLIALDGLTTSAGDSTPAHEALMLFGARREQYHLADLTDEDRSYARRICELVDGLPLAIELAAALTRTHALRSIVARMEEGFDELTTPWRDAQPRHQSLRQIFVLSWDALTTPLQQRLAQLSVFRGGFSADAAHAIAHTSDDQLAALVQRSLLSYTTIAHRYNVHPVIRTYAAEQLLAQDQTQHHHAQYYLRLLGNAHTALHGQHPPDAVAHLDQELDNIRLAWQTGLSIQCGPDLTDALGALATYYQLRGLSHEGATMMQTTGTAALTWGASGEGLVLRAGLELARFQNRLGQYWPAMHTSQDAARRAAAMGDDRANGMAHIWCSESLWRLGKYDAARVQLEHAHAIAQQIDAQDMLGWYHHHMGIIHDIQGRYQPAQDHLYQACAIWQWLGNATPHSVSLNSLGLVAYHRGRLPVARQIMEQALAICEQVDNRHLQALVLNNLGMVTTEQHDYDGAQGYLERGLALAVSNGNQTGQAEVQINLGRNQRSLGQHESALALLQQGLQQSEALGYPTGIATALLNLAELAAEQGDIPRASVQYQQALQSAQHADLRLIQCVALLGLAALNDGTPAWQARQYASDGLALALTLGNDDLVAQARTTLHRLPAAEHRSA